MSTQPNSGSTQGHREPRSVPGHSDLNSSFDVTHMAAIPKSMRVFAYQDYGDPSCLKPMELDTPEPDSSQCLIQVAAASVNPIDTRLRAGEMKGLLLGGFPRVPGYDVAGVIVRSESDHFAVGQRVMAFLDHVYGGGFAQYAVCSDDALAALPETMSYEEAAALPLAGSTALQSLRNYGDLQANERVLINGASGGVGAFAVQIAVALGATVDAVASKSNESFCVSLGAERCFDYEQTDFTKLSDRWDLIFDAAGKSSFLSSRASLKEHGRYVSTEPSVKGLAITLLTSLMDKQGKIMLAKPKREDLEFLIGLYNTEQLKVTIDDVIPFEEAVEAHRRLEEGVERGKIVVRIA